MAKKTLYLIDATAFCYRAFYALAALSTSFGQPTNAIYGFMNILNKVLKDNSPEYLAVCFDVSRDTFRARKFAEYKINRPGMPDELSSQIPFIKKIVKAFGIVIAEKEGFEADDVIATLALKAKEEGMPVVIISSDKDILQLVSEDIAVFSPHKDVGVLYDKDNVYKRYGINPEQITDIISLMGDSVDNIPGVPGIGEKTAVALIKKFGSISNLLKSLKDIAPEKIRNSITDNIELIKLNSELVLLDKNVPLGLGISDLKLKAADYGELLKLFKYLEFKKFLKALPIQEETSPSKEAGLVNDKDLKGLVNDQDEFYLSGNSLKDLAFGLKGEAWRINEPAESFGSILANPKIKKIGHDLKRLKLILEKNDFKLGGLYFDTMIAAYLCNPSKSSYDLEELSWDYLGKNILGEGTDSIKALSQVLELKPKLENELKEKSLEKLFHDTEMPLVEVLSSMEMAGIKIDIEALGQLSGELDKRLFSLVRSIYKIAGSEFNINSPKQLREVLFEKLKLPVVKRTKTGPSTDEEALRSLAASNELPALLLEYRQLTKLKNTYIDALPKLVDPATGRIHTSFNQAGTETGRLSSTNPNLQNLPVKTEIGRKIRGAVVSFDKKSLLLSCDYSQVELRVLAHLSKDKELIEAFLKERDVHKITAALIFSTGENEVSDEMREVAKRINFGIVYGLSSWGLARDLGISASEAQGFIDAYFLKYSKVKEYIEKQIAEARNTGFVTTILGRRRYLPEINSRNQAIRQLAERQAVNTPIQGTASDLIKLAMIKIYQEFTQKNYLSKMILQVHDELVFNVPENELDKVKENVKFNMENILKLCVPLRVSMKFGKNWLDMEEIK